MAMYALLSVPNRETVLTFFGRRFRASEAAEGPRPQPSKQFQRSGRLVHA